MEPITTTMAHDDPERLAMLEKLIAGTRMGTAAMLADAGDDFDAMQSALISASATMAGMTAGHMMAFGTLSENLARRPRIRTGARGGVRPSASCHRQAD